MTGKVDGTLTWGSDAGKLRDRATVRVHVVRVLLWLAETFANVLGEDEKIDRRFVEVVTLFFVASQTQNLRRRNLLAILYTVGIYI